MGVQYRCTKADCRKRVTLRKPLEHYWRIPKCPGCGRKHTLSHVGHKEKERTRRRTCYCSGIPFPHRRGTIIDEHRTCREADIFEIGLREEFGDQIQISIKNNPRKIPF